MMVELVSQHVKQQSWICLKKELACSAGLGEHVLSEYKGPVLRGEALHCEQKIIGISFLMARDSSLRACVFKCSHLFLSHAQADSSQ